jgi:hypothetical protein
LPYPIEWPYAEIDFDMADLNELVVDGKVILKWILKVKYERV